MRAVEDAAMSGETIMGTSLMQSRELPGGKHEGASTFELDGRQFVSWALDDMLLVLNEAEVVSIWGVGAGLEKVADKAVRSMVVTFEATGPAVTDGGAFFAAGRLRSHVDAGAATGSSPLASPSSMSRASVADLVVRGDFGMGCVWSSSLDLASGEHILS